MHGQIQRFRKHASRREIAEEVGKKDGREVHQEGCKVVEETGTIVGPPLHEARAGAGAEDDEEVILVLDA
jgi:hypothetical protein